ncbi:MAG: Ig-like domain-containing protein, partial [Gemmatimonadetes bacterium]|nr:Ig-like domain-containing protein [Gemmatimonadota bacterium]
PASLTISPASVSFTAVGDTEQLSARVVDQYGNVMSGVSVVWASLRPTVAQVDVTTGLVTSAGAGTATISARAQSASGEAMVTVQQEVEALEKAAGDGQEGYFGEALPVAPAVRVLDRNGHPAAEITVNFEVTAGGGSVSHSSIVTRSEGIAETVWTMGTDSLQTLSATAAGFTAEFRATASHLALIIATDSLPQGRATLEYAQALTARGGSGSGYSWSLAEGAAIPPGLALSEDGTLHGTPEEAGDFEFGVRLVDSEGGEATATLGMKVCDGPLGLALGDVRVATANDMRGCGLFIRAPRSSAYYRVTLAGLDASNERIFPVELMAEGIAPSQAPGLRPVVAAAERAADPTALHALDPDWERALEIEDANAALHYEIRRQEAEMFARLEDEGRLAGMLERGIEAQIARREALAAGGQMQADSPAQRQFRLYNRDGGDRCSIHRTVTAGLIAENDHLVVYEDTAAASPVPVANVERVIDFYSEHGAEVIERYFGGVSDVNGDGRVLVLVDPELNGVRGYVWSGDMTFTALDCPTSNETELIHMSAGSFTELDDDRYWAMAGLVHEMKHVSSLYKRVRSDVLRGRPAGVRTFHPTWIEEGTAEIAKEMSSRLAWERAGGPAMRDRANRTIIRDGLSNMRSEVWGTFQVMARVVRAFSVDPNAVTFEPRDEGHVYGSGWHFHRLLRDILAGGDDAQAADEALVLALNDSSAIPGVLGIAEATGLSLEDLLTKHAIALTVAGAEPWLTDDDTPRFLGYDFPTATEIFSNPDPPGRYPWPVTLTGEEDDSSEPSVPLARTLRFSGEVGSSGVRVFDFEAVDEGAGAIFRLTTLSPIAVIVARIPRPPGF